MSGLYTALYIGLVIVGALLLLGGMYINIDALITAFATARGMDKTCRERIQALQAKVDDLGERLELRDKSFAMAVIVNETLTEENIAKERIIGGLRIELDRCQRGLPPRWERTKENQDAS